MEIRVLALPLARVHGKQRRSPNMTTGSQVRSPRPRPGLGADPAVLPHRRTDLSNLERAARMQVNVSAESVNDLAAYGWPSGGRLKGASSRACQVEEVPSKLGCIMLARNGRCTTCFVLQARLRKTRNFLIDSGLRSISRKKKRKYLLYTLSSHSCFTDSKLSCNCMVGAPTLSAKLSS